jgi:hypothetical protein
MVQAARKLLKGPSAYRERLRQIINGKVKSVDADWWRTENGVAPWQVAAKLEKKFKAKLDKITAMADPARNPSAHQRQVAEAALAKLQAAGAPKAARMQSAPGLEEYDRKQAQRQPPPLPSLDELLKARAARQGRPMRSATARPVNTTTAKAEPRPINTTKLRQATKPANTTAAKKPRTADRHREPNRDRHSPGYMREYMRRRRAQQKA